MPSSSNNLIDDSGRKRSERMDDLEPLVVRPRIAAKLLGCSVGRVYELIASGILQSYLDGPKSRKVTTDSIRTHVARQLEADSGTRRDTSKAVTKSIASRRAKAAARRGKARGDGVMAEIKDNGDAPLELPSRAAPTGAAEVDKA
jgi:hypothetical protein